MWRRPFEKMRAYLPFINNSMNIEDGVPITNNSGRRTEYPWRELQVGQSFVHPKCQTDVNKTYWERVLGRSFITRATEDGQTRVWRTK